MCRETYEADGARLSYWQAGAGVPVVFLHPTPVDGEFWRPLIGELAGVQAIVPDFRGHGASELGSNLPVGGFARVPNAPVLSIAQLASDVIALLDRLGLEKPIIVGCSVGGYTLLELWRRAPERIRGLAFICSKPQADAEANLEKRVETIAKVRASGTAAIFDGAAQTLIGPTARRLRPNIVNEMRARMTLTPEAQIAMQAGLATRADSMPTVDTISAPTIAIAAAEDGAVTPEEMKAFCVAPGGCAYHLLPDAGHFAAYEQPAKVAGLLTGWLHQCVP
jgi:pimeloyl-ACP methyl ester carboxylesterase